jgi:regulator of RNase E activity RraA
VQPVEPWECAVRPIPVRAVPDDLARHFRGAPDIVEELSDRLRADLGVETSIELGHFQSNREDFIHVGPIATVRYAPRAIFNNENRLGHAKIAEAVPADAIVLTDARGCGGGVLGGLAAATIRGGGAAVCLLDGQARDIDEVSATGLIVMAARFGIRAGRSAAQVIEIGGPMTFGDRFVCAGDVGIVNRRGLVTIPAWIEWDAIRRILGLPTA